MAVTIDDARFKVKIQKIQKRMKENVANALETIMDKLTSDILINRYSSHPGYDMLKSGVFHQAVQEARFVDRKKLVAGFLTDVMDQRTSVPTAKGNFSGLGYWRLYEYGGATVNNPRAGSRVGKSSTHRFVPLQGAGLYGEGAMMKGGTHPGVYPTRLFRNTINANRKMIRETISRAIKAAIAGTEF